MLPQKEGGDHAYLQVLLPAADGLPLLRVPLPALQRGAEGLRLQARLRGQGYQFLQTADIPLLLEIRPENPVAVGRLRALLSGLVKPLEGQAGIGAGHHLRRQTHLQPHLAAQWLQFTGIAGPALRVVVGVYLGLRRLGQLEGEVFDCKVQFRPDLFQHSLQDVAVGADEI